MDEFYNASQKEHYKRKKNGYKDHLTGAFRLKDCFSTILLKVRGVHRGSMREAPSNEYLWILTGYGRGGEDEIRTFLLQIN